MDQLKLKETHPKWKDEIYECMVEKVFDTIVCSKDFAEFGVLSILILVRFILIQGAASVTEKAGSDMLSSADSCDKDKRVGGSFLLKNKM